MIQSLPGLERLTERLGRQADITARLLEAVPGGAAGIGEAAVASTRVHLLLAGRPGLVQVVVDSDAGQVFYGRSRPGEVLHIDIFHAEGEVDHRAVARNLVRAARIFARDAGTHRMAGLPLERVPDYVDLQTGTGGGRASGTLVYGRRASLRLAHRNHVHLAIGLPRPVWGFAVYAVAAVEEVVLASGLELRRVERVEVVRGQGGRPLDLSDYATASDSLLREAPGGAGAGGLAPAHEAADSRSGTTVHGRASSRWGGAEDALAGEGSSPDTPGEVGAGGAAGARGGPGGASAPGAVGDGPAAWSGSIPSPPVSEADRHRLLRLGLGLLRETGLDTGLALLERLAGGAAARDLQLAGTGHEDIRRWLAELRAAGLLHRDGERYRLSETGQQLLWLLRREPAEVRLALRKVLRHRPVHPDRHPGRGGPVVYDDEVGPDVNRRVVQPWQAGGRGDGIAVTETVVAALARHGLPLQVTPGELRQYRRVRRQPVDVCLLLDASASMAGSRIRAAKDLARQLLVSTRDRVAVVTFQERSVQVQVPLTRNTRRVERGLSQIQPYGLTPLAQGLDVAVAFLRESRARNPLLVLITDGIPTVPYRSANPLEDAVQVARQLAAGRHGQVGFTCIGLQPNERYLRELVGAAGGRLYVVDELERDTLVAIVHRERWQRKERTRTL
ncbi:MAG: VWA domain-containing protein [Bacillota bacterium]|nr:MAG: VWA domain-containing protein [Bacillota bacterium]